MTIAFSGSGVGSDSSTSASTNISTGTPDDGDLLIIFGYQRGVEFGANMTVAASGMTFNVIARNHSEYGNFGSWWARYDATTAAANPTITVSGRTDSNTSIGIIACCFSGADTSSSPLSNIGSITTQASASSYTVTGPTGLTTGTMMIGLGGSMDNNAPTAEWSGSGSGSYIANNISAGADAAHALAYELEVSGTAGNFTYTLTSVAPDTGATQIFGIKPSGPSTLTGEATVTGAGTISAAAVQTLRSTATVTGAGSTSATASIIKYGTATVAGEGSVSASGTAASYGTATVTGVGTVSASASQIIRGTATVTGAGSVTANSLQTLRGTATITGSGSATAAGSVIKYGTATVSGEGSVSAAASQISYGTATVNGAGSVSADASVEAASVYAYFGWANVIATYIAASGSFGEATILGQGSVSATGTVTAYGAATVSGEGSVSASASKIIYGTATVTGEGSVAAAGSKIIYGTSTVTGAGDVTASSSLIKYGAATVDGTGSVSAVGSKIIYGTATVAGAGSVSADGSVQFSTIQGTATVTGEGAVTANSSLTKYGTSTVTGAGEVTAVATQNILGTATVTGEGSVTATGGISGMSKTVDAIEAVAAGSVGSVSPSVEGFANYALCVVYINDTTTNGKQANPVVASAAGVAYNATTPTFVAVAECAEAVATASDAFEVYAGVAVAEASIFQYMPMVDSSNVIVDAITATATASASSLLEAQIDKSLWSPIRYGHEGDFYDPYYGPSSWYVSDSVPPYRYIYGNLNGQVEAVPNPSVPVPDSTRAAHGTTSVHVGRTDLPYSTALDSGGTIQGSINENYESPFSLVMSAYYYFTGAPPAVTPNSPPDNSDIRDGIYLGYLIDRANFISEFYFNPAGDLVVIDGAGSWYIRSDNLVPLNTWVRFEFWATAASSYTNGYPNNEVGLAMYYGDSLTPIEVTYFESPARSGSPTGVTQFAIGSESRAMVEHWYDDIQILNGDGHTPHPWPYAEAGVATASATAHMAMKVEAQCAFATATAEVPAAVRGSQYATPSPAVALGYLSYSPVAQDVKADQHSPEAAIVGVFAFDGSVVRYAYPDTATAAGSANAASVRIQVPAAEATVTGVAYDGKSVHYYVDVPDSASASATANDATVLVTATAVVAQGSVVAYNLTTLVEVGSAYAEATVTAYMPPQVGAVDFAADAEVAIAVGSVGDTSRYVYPTVTAATATATAYQSSVLKTVTASAGLASVTGAAYDCGSAISALIEVIPGDVMFMTVRPMVKVRNRVAQYLIEQDVFEDYMSVNSLFYRMDRNGGISILIEDGEVKEVISPREDRAQAAEHYYPGGHQNIIGQDEADILTQAGYLVTEVDPEWVIEEVGHHG